MILLLCIISLFLWAFIIQKARPGIGLIRLCVFGLCGFFFLYTVVSAGFFWVDCFTFGGVLACCIVLQVLLAGWMTCVHLPGTAGEQGRFWQSLKMDVTFDGRQCVIPLVIALLALPFTWNKFELYSMGQDQGTYQVKALALMNGETHNYMEMKEFTRLETPEERQKYLDFIYGQNNLYLPRVIEETETDAAAFEKIVGTIHGLPTYSALLALWGMLFGYPQMIGVQTVLYLCSLFLIWFVCENMRLHLASCTFVTLMTAASPIVLWLSKSSLTEIGIMLLVCWFLYALTAEKSHWTCMIPIVVFAFYHISLYAFMPIFVLVLAVMYIARQDKGYLYAIMGSVAGYGVGAIWAFMIAPYYSYGNYSELGRITGGLLGEKTLIPLITTVCLSLVVLCFVLQYSGAVEARVFAIFGSGGNEAHKICAGTGAVKENGIKKVVCLLIRILLLLSLLFFVYKGVVQGETTTACEYLQISTYIYMSGMLMIPVIYIAMFLKPGAFLKDELRTSLTLLFLYCVVMYSMVMRVRILYYYYFARYAALFLPVIFLVGVQILEEMNKRVAVLLAVCMFLTFVPYDQGLLYQKDHSRCEWVFLEDVCEYIGPEDAFIVGPDEQQIVFIFPVKLLTGCDVYYADEGLDKQLKQLAQVYEHVYYMDYDTAFEDNWGSSAVLAQVDVTKIYTNWNHLSYLDYFNISNPLTPIPLDYVEYRLKLSLYEVKREVER